MSFNIFENTNLDFDVSIIKMGRVRDSNTVIQDVIESVTPIDAAAVLNLELYESSLAMGFTGTITINNKFKILDNLNITTNSPNDVYIAIRITDLDLQQIADIPKEDTCVTLVGYINNTSAGSINIIDNIVIFEFEEAFVAAMKQTQAYLFAGKTFNNESKPENDHFNVLSLANSFNEKFYKLNKDNYPITTIDSSTPNVDHDIKTAFVNTNGIRPSVYDAIQEMAKEEAVGEVAYNSPGKVSYFRFVNRLLDPNDSDSDIIRQLKFAPFLSDRHLQFVKAVVSNQSREDFSDVYTEKFTLGPFAETADDDPNTTLYNKIETYNISRANTGQLKETLWGDYRFDKQSRSSDMSMFTPADEPFSKIQRDFIQINLTDLPVSLNLPILREGEYKDFHIPFNSHVTDPDVERSIKQQQNRIANTVHKSFLTIVETITFKVKGSVIRRPNTFIWIEDSQTDENYKKLWYVNSVKHIFASGKYSTEVVATKIFGDVSLQDIGIDISNLPLGTTDLRSIGSFA